MNCKIPFNIPYITGEELKYIEKAISNKKIGGDGEFTDKITTFLEKRFKIKKACFVTSGSVALDISVKLLGLGPGDEVIMPTYTYMPTANAVLLQKAKPVFADIEPTSMHISPDAIESKLTSKTRAIFPVHYAGVSCEMDSIIKIARANNLFVVEDAAQGVNAKYKSDYLGSLGDLGCFSFHESKNYTCGEGGALLVNREELIERAEIIRDKGTNRREFLRGKIERYTWMDVGSSYMASDLLAAFLYAQFQQIDLINQERKKLFEQYFELLKPLEENELIELPVIPKECDPNYHIVYFLCNKAINRDSLLKNFHDAGIQAFEHYVPLHLTPMGKKLGNEPGDFPISEDRAKRLIRLPLYIGLGIADINFICQKLEEFLTSQKY